MIKGIVAFGQSMYQRIYDNRNKQYADNRDDRINQHLNDLRTMREESYKRSAEQEQPLFKGYYIPTLSV